jgi:hypothetical protein
MGIAHMGASRIVARLAHSEGIGRRRSVQQYANQLRRRRPRRGDKCT